MRNRFVTKSPTQIIMDQFRSAFLLVLLAILSNILWSLFRYIWPLSPATMLEQNSESPVTSTPTPDTIAHDLFAGARSKKKTITALTLQQQSGDEPPSRRYPYLVFFGIPITHEPPPKWMENEEVLCHLRVEVSHLTPSN